jgi:hypothetical protein
MARHLTSTGSLRSLVSVSDYVTHRLDARDMTSNDALKAFADFSEALVRASVLAVGTEPSTSIVALRLLLRIAAMEGAITRRVAFAMRGVMAGLRGVNAPQVKSTLELLAREARSSSVDGVAMPAVAFPFAEYSYVFAGGQARVTASEWPALWVAASLFRLLVAQSPSWLGGVYVCVRALCVRTPDAVLQRRGERVCAARAGRRRGAW